MGVTRGKSAEWGRALRVSSARSGDLLGNWIGGAHERSRRPDRDPIRKKLVSREHHIGLDRLALAVGTHLGSIALSHGLFLGTKQGTMRTPWPPFLTSRLWAAGHSLTNLLLCQLALSQIRSRASFLPIASSFWQLHRRNCVVVALTGRPPTNLSQLRPSSSGR